MPIQGRRRLAAIMFTDIVGYSRVMQEDEARGRLLRERHKQVFEQCTARFEGRIVQYFGDGTLSVFDSAVSAVECAVCMQKSLKTYPQVPLRIGIHLGDIHYDETEVYGHGVNVAARIEPVCNPGGVFISEKVFDEIQNHPWLKASSVGVYSFKNIDQDLSLYAVNAKDVTFPNDEDIENISRIAKREHFSSTGKQSAAVKRFLKDRRSEQRLRYGKLAGAALVLLLAIVAFFKLGLYNPPVPPNGTGKTSIAVLPFANMTADEENEYFSDGMTEDILTRLSKIEGLAVTSRTSVMQYKSTNKTTREIARELGVSHILEGSVRRDGDRVRINAQLVDAQNDAHIWAQTYDEKFTSIFDVQSQVATDIAEKLKVELSEEDLRKMGPDRNYSVDAYDLYLRGREYYRKYTQEANEKAIDLFYEALAIEPQFSYAFAGLGDAYAQKAYRFDMDGALLDSAVLMSAKAVAIDPNLSEGYKALGLAYHYKGAWDTAKTQYVKALELDPSNDMAASNLAMIEREQGEYTEAAKWAHRTLELNKNVPASAANMAGLYIEVGDDEQAEEVLDKGLAVNPKAPELKILKSEVSLREGRYDEAEKWAQEIIDQMPDNPVGYQLLGNAYLYENEWDKAADAYHSAEVRSKKEEERVMQRALKIFSEHKRKNSGWSDGDAAQILESLDSIEKRNSHMKQTVALIRAGVETQVGEYEDALEHLETAVGHHWMDYKAGARHPMFNELNGMPEFEALVSKMKHKSDSLIQEVHIVTRKDGT